MNTEYNRLRALGWQAQAALRAAKVREEFEHANTEGRVRLRVTPDEHADLENLKGDCFNPDVNHDIPLSRLRREEKEFEQKASNDGVWGIIGEYFDGEEWQHADSCWGFVGEDWRDSGTDTEIMSATLEAFRSLEKCPACGRPERKEA